MINSWYAVNFTKSETCNDLHFCHACLNLLMDELAVAQCSSFVKHHEWIPAMYFVVMFECCSIFILMHLDGYLLLIADRCHICFACHFLTMHPIPVIFISISTQINSSFQRHSWISKLRPGSFIPFQIMPMHHILHPAYHTMFASCCCHVHMLAIVFYDPFWLKVTKGLLLSSLSSFMPCLALPWYVPVACSFHALKCASWW